jgi:arylsulfatase A-like enzyme
VTETEFGHQFGQGDGVYGMMLSTARYKYVVYSEGNLREQLTDMEQDPGEMVNLAESPKHKAILEDHQSRLAAWCRKPTISLSYRKIGDTTVKRERKSSGNKNFKEVYQCIKTKT